jgi:hypothetical protein
MRAACALNFDHIASGQRDRFGSVPCILFREALAWGAESVADCLWFQPAAGLIRCRADALTGSFPTSMRENKLAGRRKSVFRGNPADVSERTRRSRFYVALAFAIGANTANLFGGQYSLIFRRPLYFFNHHHIDRRPG